MPVTWKQTNIACYVTQSVHEATYILFSHISCWGVINSLMWLKKLCYQIMLHIRN